MNRQYSKVRFDERSWKKAKRGIGVLLGAALWWAGYTFSRGGLEAFLDLPKDHWLGYLLGIVVTWLQINLNEGAEKQPTLFVAGIFSYIYGFFTNWWGLFLFQSKFFDVGIFEAFNANPIEWVFRVILTVIFGAFVEVLPEHMITLGLFGESYASDLLRSLATGTQIRESGQRESNYRQRTVRPMEPRIEQTHRTNRRMTNKQTNHRTNKPFPYPVNWGNLDKNTNIYKIVMFYREYYAKHGRECRNNIVEDGTGIGKSQVSTVLKSLKAGEFA